MHSKKMSKKCYLLLHDINLIVIMGVLAACGLIYEYLLSHYAGRILGSVETAIYSMIGIMIVAMGVGAFLAKFIKSPFTIFAWLEVVIAILGAGGILLIAAIIAFTHQLPHIITDTFGLPEKLSTNGGVFLFLEDLVRQLPYVLGALLGLFIGMEIPLIARVREAIHGEHLIHNIGTIYGADYIGAGLGAAIWVIWMLSIDITTAAILTASINVIAGLVFLFVYWQKINTKKLLVLIHMVVVGIILIIAIYGKQWAAALQNVLYMDQVVYQQNTNYQYLAITRRFIGKEKLPIYSFYINGRLQFCTCDEQIYHSMLVYPAMLASARHDKILIIGGGDGLALRDVLRWQPKQVRLIDLDKDLVNLFTQGLDEQTPPFKQALLMQNAFSFSDQRVKVGIGDAFLEIDNLLAAGQVFDTIIVDLPDPNHPDLNKLYSTHFYARLRQLLAGDGAISIQSTSPYHAKNAFLSIGKTLRAVGFEHVEQYHQNVPSFGEWGWTIATKMGASAKKRIANMSALPLKDPWLTQKLLLSAFEFPNGFFANLNQIKINHLGSHVTYQYHHEGWQHDYEFIVNHY